MTPPKLRIVPTGERHITWCDPDGQLLTEAELWPGKELDYLTTRPANVFTRAPFATVGPLLEDLGYPSVPIKPGEKAPLVDDWQAGHPVTRWLPGCRSWGTGILTATCPAIDVDIRDKELVRALIDLADELIGLAPFRIGAPPKALLPFATDEPFEKILSRWFALPGDDWRAPKYTPHRIEVLGRGQQFVAYARHPRGTFYRWRRGEPLAIQRCDLPELTEHKARLYVAAAEEILRDVGAVALRLEDGAWRQEAIRVVEPARPRRVNGAGDGPFTTAWRTMDAGDLAKRIDPQGTVAGKRVGASSLKSGQWVCKCPAHNGEGHRSLAIKPGRDGGLLVYCHAGCEFVEIAKAIGRVVGR
jgi:hypothetical protein